MLRPDKESVLRLVYRVLFTGLVLATALSSFASRVHRGPTSAKHKSSKSKKADATVHPRAIDDARAAEIQTALVKAGYLQEVSGHWDNESQAAMQKLQGDNGWQTKLIPDSRALIKLGLGPNARNESPANGTGRATFVGAEDQNGI